MFCRRPVAPSRSAAATTAAAAARATAAASGGAAGAGGAGGATGSAGAAAGAGGAGPITDRHCLSWPLSRQLQRLGVDSGGGEGFGFLRTAQRRQESQQETFSPQVLSELVPQRCVIGSVKAAALGASESAATLGASESAAALGASESAAAPDASESAANLGARASPTTGPTSAEALHTFTLDSGVSRCFFCDCTTLTPLAAPVLVSLVDPTGSPVVARASTVLPCPAIPSGSLSGLHLPMFLTNLVSNATIQDVWINTLIPGERRMAICTCSRTGHHLATFTRRPGSSLYTLTTASAQVAEVGQVAVSSQVSVSCSCRVLSHKTLLWHHRLGHPSLLRLRSMHSHLLVFGLPRSLPSIPRLPALPCLPCVEGRQRAAPHSSEFPPTTATLGVLIPWICATHRLLRERFCQDFLVLRLHSDRGGEFSFDLPAEFCRDEGICQSFTLPASPQQNGIAERRIGLIMEVAHTSMIHAASPHFLWPFAVEYAAHQLNLWPRVFEQETSPTLRWTGKVGDASVFRVWGALSLVRDTTASKLYRGGSTTRARVESSPPRTSPLTSLPPTPVDSLPPQGPAPSAEGDDPAADDTAATHRAPRLETPPGFPPRLSSPPPQPAAVDSGAETASAEPGGAETEGEGSGGVATGGAGSGGAETGGADSGGAASPSGGGAVGDPIGEVLELESHRSLIYLRRSRRRRFVRGSFGKAVLVVEAASPGGTGGATGARDAGPTSPGGPTGAGGAAAAGTGGAGAAGGTKGAGATGPGGPAGVGGAGGPAGGAGGVAGVGGTRGAIGAGGTRATSPAGPRGAGGAGASGAGGAGDSGGVLGAGGDGATTAGGTGAASAGGPAGTGGTGPAGALRHLLGLPPAPTEFPVPGTTPLVFPQLLPHSPLPAPAPYTAVTESLTERREPDTRASTLERRELVTRASTPEQREPKTRASVRARVPCVRHSRAPSVTGTHDMTLRPSSIPQRFVLPSPPASSLPAVADPPSDLASTSSPTVSRFLATVVTDPTLSSPAASALVAELVDFSAVYHLDYLASLVFDPDPAYPPSVGGEVALGCDVLEDREAISGEYYSQWQTAMDSDMASWNSTGTYVDEVPPPGANIVIGMWIFRVKRPPGSPPAFKTRYVARGFSQREGVDFFHTFSPIPKMTILWVLLHVAALRDYELHSLDFSTPFLQGSLHEAIWLRRPPGFNGSFPEGTQWSLRRPVYGLRQAPRKWYDTVRTTLAALGAISGSNPSVCTSGIPVRGGVRAILSQWSSCWDSDTVFLRTDTTLPPFYVLVYVDDLVLATVDMEALALVKAELQERHTCIDLGASTLRLPVLLATAHSSVYLPLDLSSTFGRVLHRAWGSCLEDGIQCYEAEIYAGAMGAQELCWLTYLLSDLGERPRSPPILYVDIKAMLALCHEQRLEHRTKHIALRYFLARELQQRRQLRLSYVASRANTADVFTNALGSGDHCWAE
ncbi:unnamed protein product [Closterium sp. NIES-53]